MISGKEVFDRIISQVEFGFLFFIDDYLYRDSAIDVAGIRCLQLLISYHVELLLKAIYVFRKSFVDEKEVEKELISLGHNMENIGNKLGNQELSNIGIKNIKKGISGGYVIETTEGRKIYVEDFIDIRYDFIIGRIRRIFLEDDNEIREDIKVIKEIIKKVKINLEIK
jgi:hypothetical protein